VKKEPHTGDRIRMARQRKKLSQEQLAALITMSRSSVSGYEITGNVPQEVLKQIWEKLETTEERIEEIMNEDEVYDTTRNYDTLLQENQNLRNENERYKNTIQHLEERIRTLEKAMGLKQAPKNKLDKKR